MGSSKPTKRSKSLCNCYIKATLLTQFTNMDILQDLIILLSVSALTLYINTRLNLPSIVGFLMAGALVGPYGIELISTAEEVDEMAEIGILLLLFTIGIEFSLEKLLKSKRLVLIGGGMQVFTSILVFFAAAYLFGMMINQAIFIGMLIAMSSTAIVLQIFQDKGWMSTIFGQSSVSILIFQDIIIIPMMLLTPYLSTTGSMESGSLSKLVLSLLFAFAVVVAARKLIPPLLRRIIHTRNQELFLITIIVICFATAFITKQLGLKLALGAFLAGLIISESEYSYEALRNVMPFKKIFTSIFFISVGMLLNLRFVADHFFVIILISLGVMLIKFLLIVPISYYLHTGFQNALITGLVLCQVGEFAFILSKTGLDANLLSAFNYQVFLSVSIISMIVSAIVISAAPEISEKLMNLGALKRWMLGLEQKDCLPRECELIGHTVIIGYGPGGKRVARYLEKNKSPLAIVELNERNIRDEDRKLADIIIGDASDTEVLQRANVASAKQVIITVPDAATTELITIRVRKENHNANIVVRTRYAEEVDELQKLGANHVVPEETSVVDKITALMAV